MDSIFSDRISDVPRSFIREILKVTSDRSVISFAGGLPNRDLFPIAELKQAAIDVFDVCGSDSLQYGNSEGHMGLREMIAQRYRDRKGLEIGVDDILITNGSQQGLDLIGKVFVNERDPVVIEEPGYLGAIQAFSIFRPRFCPTPLAENGMDVGALKSLLSRVKPKLVYAIPNFQNPSGVSYSHKNRREVASLLQDTSTLLIEDDPYGDLRYSGTPAPSFGSLLPNNTILLGTFSKMVVPGFRLGWIAARGEVMEKLIVAKQAADLHTSQFTQNVLYQYLKCNDIDGHIAAVKEAYGRQLRAMLDSIEEDFPAGVSHTRPEGGMFVWAVLPELCSSRELLEMAMKAGVIFVPGDPFYVNRSDTNTMRLNFTCADEATIREGIARLGKAIRSLLARTTGGTR